MAVSLAIVIELTHVRVPANVSLSRLPLVVLPHEGFIVAVRVSERSLTMAQTLNPKARVHHLIVVDHLPMAMAHVIFPLARIVLLLVLVMLHAVAVSLALDPSSSVLEKLY